MNQQENLAHDEDGALIPHADFDFDSIDGADDKTDPFDDIDPSGVYRAMHVLLQWVFQDGSKNDDGLAIRAAIVCWIFIPYARRQTMTDLARGLGLHKQSVGRWHDDFKKKFPSVKTPHMQFKK